jgi:AraC-like DNA-binding protein
MHYAEIDLPPALTPFVRAVWHLHGSARAESAESIIPDGCMEIVLNFGDPVTQHGAGPARVQPVCMIVGQLREPIAIAPVGNVDIWGIRLQPWAGGALLGMPAIDLAGLFTPMDAVSPSGLTHALASAGSADGDAERTRLIVRALGERAARVSLAPNVMALARRAESSRDDPTVGALAAWAGLSARRVQKVFSETVGLSPRALMRIGRFQRALTLARAHPSMTWGAIAARCGYYDHAHLVRDSRQFAGQTPKAVMDDPARLTEIFLSREQERTPER